MEGLLYLLVVHVFASLIARSLFRRILVRVRYGVDIDIAVRRSLTTKIPSGAVPSYGRIGKCTEEPQFVKHISHKGNDQ